MTFPTNITLEKAQELVSALEANQSERVAEIVDDMTNIRETELHQRLTQLTKNLHETLSQLDDSPLLDQTKNDLPDVAERIQYVKNKTEEASNSTLQMAESALAKLESLRADSSNQSLIESLHQDLTEIILAQAYQDLTGQVLNRIMLILQSLENSLIELIEKSGHDYHAIPKRDTANYSDAQLHKGVGPATHKDNDTASSQEDVDDLLSDLGI